MATEHDPNANLLDVASQTARILADPDGIYAKNPDAKARLETQMAALLLRAGVQPKAEDAPSLAARVHDENFQFRDGLHPNQGALVEQRIAEVEKGDVKSAAAELRRSVGADDYDRMIEDAKRVRPNLGGAAADLTVLRLLAQNGRYRAQYMASKPGKR